MLVKIGSSTLTQGTKKISRGKIEDLANQLNILKESYEIVLVSSGAIAAAKQFVELNKARAIKDKQALAAIGQLQLMRIYQEVFRDYNLNCAQCLLTYSDFKNHVSRQNMRNTLETLMDNDYIPIINENDTVATEEIQFGDNDKLAALTAELLEADLMVLVTDIDGCFNKDPKEYSDAEIIPVINDLKPYINELSQSGSELGSGGMKSKLESAEIAQKAGVETWIINGSITNFIIRAMKDEITFTKILTA